MRLTNWKPLDGVNDLQFCNVKAVGGGGSGVSTNWQLPRLVIADEMQTSGVTNTFVSELTMFLELLFHNKTMF